MWGEVHKQHLEVLWCSQIQSAYINAKPNKRDLYQMFLYLSFILSFILFHSHSISVFCFFFLSFFLFFHACTRVLDARLCVCGCDLMTVDRITTGLSVRLSPRRKHICSKSQSSQTHSPLASNKVYYVSAVPYRSDDNHCGTMEASTEGTSESFGPRDALRSKLTNRCTATKSHRGACSLSLHRKRGVNDP